MYIDRVLFARGDRYEEKATTPGVTVPLKKEGKKTRKEKENILLFDVTY